MTQVRAKPSKRRELLVVRGIGMPPCHQPSKAELDEANPSSRSVAGRCGAYRHAGRRARSRSGEYRELTNNSGTIRNKLL